MRDYFITISNLIIHKHTPSHMIGMSMKRAVLSKTGLIRNLSLRTTSGGKPHPNC